MHKLKGIVLLFICLFLIACGNNDDQQELKRNEPEAVEEVRTELVKANNVFAFKLLNELQQDDENILLSPTSALIAMLMAYNGADGETKKEFERVLLSDSLSQDEWNEAVRSLHDALINTDDAIEVSMANAIWLHARYDFQEDFIEKMRTFFDAKAEKITLDDASVEKMNEWVRDVTNGKITDIVEGPLDPDLVMFLMNAVYFHGSWKYAFSKELTREDIFYTTNDEVYASFMTIEQELAYTNSEKYEAIRLPYGDEKISMYVFLPRPDVSLHDMRKLLEQTEWATLRQHFANMEGTLHLPKFSFEYETELNEPFQALGINRAFDEKDAEFPYMIQKSDLEPLWIEEVKQKTYIDVNETGTEAAGVTSIEIRTTSTVIGDPFEMNVNRPFLFTITDEETGMHLFIGIIENPVESD